MNNQSAASLDLIKKFISKKCSVSFDRGQNELSSYSTIPDARLRDENSNWGVEIDFFFQSASVQESRKHKYVEALQGEQKKIEGVREKNYCARISNWKTSDV